MITREQLTGTYSRGEALDIYNKVKACGNFLDFCQRFMHDDDIRVVRKALWGLSKATRTEIAALQPLFGSLVDLAMKTGDLSVRRLALSIVERLAMEEEDIRTDFLDFCLVHAVDMGEQPAIQSLCLKLAYRMCSFYPELTGELTRTIADMDPMCYTAAVKSVRKKILGGKLK